jgi:hypothetical protein
MGREEEGGGEGEGEGRGGEGKEGRKEERKAPGSAW